MVEKNKCYTLENEVEKWLFIILNEIDKKSYYNLKKALVS